MDNKKKVNVQYNVLTWGRCVVKMKMTDDFDELLLKEAEACQDRKNLYQHRLAGIIQKEYQFKDKSRILPYLNDVVKLYDKIWDKWRNSDKPSNNKYLIKALWVNFQRQHEFNPPHDHSDELSFVAYLKIPKEIKEEYDNYKGKSSGPGGISFIYGEGNRQAITYQAHFPEEKDLFIFPAWLKHYVAPFKSDVERISVSGNITSSIPIKNLQPIEPKNEEK